MARLIAQKLSDRFGKQFYVENHPGAGGNIGMAMVANAPPDGLHFAAGKFQRRGQSEPV